MVVNIAALLFVLGITFVHSLYGLFSGLLNAFCAVVALTVALGYYEPLNALITGQFHLHSNYTEPLALALLFAITLTVLRVLADRFLRGNVRVPMYLDWVGGAACGFIVGQIVVGVMVLSFLMLPWGGRAVTFDYVVRDPENRLYQDAALAPDQRKQDERVVFRPGRLWLRSDEFAAGLFARLSRGSLGGDVAFGEVYPDFAAWVRWTGNTVQPESLTAPLRDDKLDGFERGVKVESWWEQTAKLSEEFTRYRKEFPTPANNNPSYQRLEYRPQPGHRLIGVRLTLLRDAADIYKSAADHRFRPTQIRLVGDLVSPDGAREPVHYVPEVLGGADARVGANLRIVDPDANFSLPAEGPVRIDAYFEVAEGFQPRFIEYRRHARAPVTMGMLAKAPPAERLTAGGAAAGKPARDQATGAGRFVDAVNRAASGGIDRLPFVLRLERLRSDLSITLDGRLLASGRIAGDRSAWTVPEGEAESNVTRLKPPEGKRVFQLQTRARRAASIAGQALNFAGAITSQYYVYDNAGERYELVGYYAVVRRGGEDYLELVYLPDDPSFRQMLDFREGQVRRLLQEQDDALLGLIFAVPPGKSIVALDAGAGRIEFGEAIPVGE